MPVESSGKHDQMLKNSGRKVCYAKRDAYFECLDNNGKNIIIEKTYSFRVVNKRKLFLTLDFHVTHDN